MSNESVIPDYWEKSYENNLLQRIWYRARFKNLKKTFTKFPGNLKILDVGCGSGFSLEMSIPKNNGYKIHGIDTTQKQIEYCKMKRPHFNFKVGLGENIPYGNSKFDIAVLLDVIEHLTHPRKTLKEVFRVLNQPGYVIILFSKENNILFKTIWHFWKKTKGKIWKGTHLSVFNKSSIKKLLLESGFVMKRSKRLHFGMSLIVVAKKSNGN